MDRENARGRGRRAASAEVGSGAGAPSAAGRHERSRDQGQSYAKSTNWFMRHKIISAVLSVLLVALMFIVGMLIYTTSNSTSLLINRNTSQGAAQGQSYNFPKDVVNILVLGTDADAERIKEGMNARTDCVMLASINTTTKKVTLISIPRDTYVSIYDEKNNLVTKNRINSAFAFGGGLKKNGIAYAINTVSQFLGGGVPIDHYVLFDMDLVKSLINAVGGITIDVDIDATINGVHYKPGTMNLNGAAALTYARDRHNTAGGDFGRVGHQQQVMIALLKKMQSKGNIVKTIPDLYGSLGKNVTTDRDLGLLQITALAWIAKDVNIGGIKQYTIHGNNLSINGASIVVADQTEKQRILKEAFGIDYKIKNDETYSYLKGDVTKMLNAGQGIIKTAKSLLANNQKYYTDDEAEDLLSAIAEWQAASKKNDGDGMANAQQDVQTEYEILKHLIQKRKAALMATPQPTDTPKPTHKPASTDNPTPTDTPAPEDTPQPTDTPAPADTITPTDTPAPTDPPVQTDSPADPTASPEDTPVG